MALGRKQDEPGGASVAVLNLDSELTPEALAEVGQHPEVSGVDIVRLPRPGAALPWLTTS